MQAPNNKLNCPECEHAVVPGVACDWQPDQCPQFQALRKQSSQHALANTWQPVPLSMDNGEYDAVRGED